MTEPRLELYLSASSPAKSAEADAAARARVLFAAAVGRIATETSIGDHLEEQSELELLEAATAITTGRR